MEYTTMTREELANKMKISTRTLTRKMKKKLSADFLKEIEGEILLGNHVQHIYEELSGMHRIWSKVQK